MGGAARCPLRPLDGARPRRIWPSSMGSRGRRWTATPRAARPAPGRRGTPRRLRRRGRPGADQGPEDPADASPGPPTSTCGPDTTPEALAKLPPYFQKDGVVTAGNASGICDGAAALVLAERDGIAAERGLAPARPAGGVGGGGRGPQDDGHRPGPRVAARARARGPHAGRHGSGRGERGVRGPVPGGGAGAGARPRAHQRGRRRGRPRPPAGRERRPDHPASAPRAAAARRPVRARQRLHRRRPGHRGDRRGIERADLWKSWSPDSRSRSSTRS